MCIVKGERSHLVYLSVEKSYEHYLKTVNEIIPSDNFFTLLLMIGLLNMKIVITCKGRNLKGKIKGNNKINKNKNKTA